MSQNLTLVERAQAAASAAISSALRISADKDYISGIYQQIQSYKIPSINASKEAIRQAIISKGQECPTSVPFSDYASLISHISTGSGDSGNTSGNTGGSTSGSNMSFYLCMGYSGVVDTIIVTSGAILQWGSEPYSLVGEYKIVDPKANGTARRWYCPQTTAFGQYPSYTNGVSLGCMNIDTGQLDVNGEPLYDKCWAFGAGNNNPWDGQDWGHSTTNNLASPMLVQNWTGSYDCELVITPVISSNVQDVSPYGPTNWYGKEIIQTNNPVMFTYGAGASCANGFWEQISGVGLSVEAQWRLIGPDVGPSAAIIKDQSQPSETYHHWGLYGVWPGNPWGQLYSQSGDSWTADAIKLPHQYNWQSNSSAFSPIPTFIYSPSGGMAPANVITSGLTYINTVPDIGKFYNSNATIRVDVFY